MKRNIGRFTITETELFGKPAAIKKLMADCIILYADYHVWNNAIQYVAINDQFDTITAMQTPYQYTLELTDNDYKFTKAGD